MYLLLLVNFLKVIDLPQFLLPTRINAFPFFISSTSNYLDLFITYLLFNLKLRLLWSKFSSTPPLEYNHDIS